MVKTPRTRHSKAQREPLTIDLAPAELERAGHEEPPTVFSDETDTSVPPEVSERPDDLPSSVSGETPVGTESAAEETSASAGESSSTRDFTPPPRETRAEREVMADAEADDEGYGFDKLDKPESEKANASAAAPITPLPRSRSSYLAAGFAGGVIALVIALLFQFSGLLGDQIGAGREIDALRQDVEAMKSANSGELKTQVDTLAASLDAVKADLAGVKTAVASDGGASGSLQTIDDRLKQVETVVAGLNQGGGAADSDDIAVLGERIAGIEALVKAASDATSATDARVASIEQTMSALAGRVDAQAQQPKIALAIATTALKAAVDRGAPFQAELETFAAIAPNAGEVAGLRPYAEQGVPTRESLVAESDAAVAAMIASANPVDPDAGLIDRLLHSAGTLVAVKPIGEVQGTGVPEILARMQIALQNGDLQKAVEEYETLPEPTKGIGAAFAEKVKARFAAERLVDQAIANAMKA